MAQASVDAQIQAAVGAGDLAALAALLRAPARQALHAAAQVGDAAALRSLLGERRMRPSTEATAAAAAGGHAEALRVLMDAARAPPPGAELLQGALHCAAVGGHVECMRLLLEHGARPDGEVLYCAARCGSDAAFQALLQAGASLELEGADALAHAARWLEPEPVAEGRGAGEQRPDSGPLLFLLARGVPLGASPLPGGVPLLHAAVATSDLAVAKALLRAGADVHQAAPNGQLPIHYVCSSLGTASWGIWGHRKWDRAALAVLACLLDAGADANAPDPDGYRLVHLLAFAGAASGLRLAMERGADMDAADDLGRTAWQCLQECDEDVDEGMLALLERTRAGMQAKQAALEAELQRARDAAEQAARDAAAARAERDEARAQAGRDAAAAQTARDQAAQAAREAAAAVAARDAAAALATHEAAAAQAACAVAAVTPKDAVEALARAARDYVTAAKAKRDQAATVDEGPRHPQTQRQASAAQGGLGPDATARASKGDGYLGSSDQQKQGGPSGRGPAQWPEEAQQAHDAQPQRWQPPPPPRRHPYQPPPPPRKQQSHAWSLREWERPRALEAQPPPPPPPRPRAPGAQPLLPPPRSHSFQHPPPPPPPRAWQHQAWGAAPPPPPPPPQRPADGPWPAPWY
jgi:ankyrin repeat protein